MPDLAAEPWTWRVLGDGAVPIRGALDRDRAGGGAQGVIYPGSNALVFLTAVLTHAAINAGARQVEDERLQREADRLLDLLRDILADITPTHLAQQVAARWPGSAVGRLTDPSDRAERWSVDISPFFVLSQDARALTLDARVAVWSEPRGAAPAALRVVRLVSDPVSSDEPIEFWRARSGEALRRVTAGLVAEAIKIAIEDRVVSDDLPQRTVRYRDGSEERIERGHVVRTVCNRIQMRSLRGWLLSIPKSGVPKEAAEVEPPCQRVSQRMR
jgi:hypothetical protein